MIFSPSQAALSLVLTKFHSLFPSQAFQPHSSMILKAMRHFFWLAGAFYTLASTFLLSLFLSISNIHTCSFHQFTWIGCFASFPWHHLSFLLQSHVLLQNLPRILMPFFTLESAEPLFKSVNLMSKTFCLFETLSKPPQVSTPLCRLSLPLLSFYFFKRDKRQMAKVHQSYYFNPCRCWAI